MGSLNGSFRILFGSLGRMVMEIIDITIILKQNVVIRIHLVLIMSKGAISLAEQPLNAGNDHETFINMFSIQFRCPNTKYNLPLEHYDGYHLWEKVELLVVWLIQ